MGTRRRRQRQEELWYRADLAEAPGHPFYRRLNAVLDNAGSTNFAKPHATSSITRGWVARRSHRECTSE
jgi:hypothetical protein